MTKTAGTASGGSGTSATNPGCHRAQPRLVSLRIKVALGLFILTLVPSTWRQFGPAGFLWLCYVSLFLTLAAAWLESALLASMAMVGVLVIQLLWLGGLARGLTGFGVSEPMQYMFDPHIPLFVRGLSLYHGWLPFLLLFLLKRLGYDRRALACYLPLAGIIFLLCYFFTPPPPAPVTDPHLPVNLNFVYGLRSSAPQSWMAPGWWLVSVILGAWLVLFLPAHLLLCRLLGPPPGRQS